MKIMGHRGSRNEAPENTLKGFQHAINHGATAMELDIHLTDDGEIVVIHDDTLERTTNGTGKVLDKSLEELKELDAGEGEKIPTLTEALELLCSQDIETQIEIKAAGTEGLTADILRKMVKKYPRMEGRLIVISFNHFWLRSFHEMAPEFPCGCLLYGLPMNGAEVVEAAGAQGISLNVGLVNQEIVNQCHDKGQHVTVWNANDKETFLKMKELGVDFVGTDVVKEAATWLS